MFDGSEEDVRSGSMAGGPVVADRVVVATEPNPVAMVPVDAEPLLVNPATPTEVTSEIDPVANPPVAEVHEVVAPVTAVPMVTTGTVRSSYARSFAPDAIAAALVGLFITLVGLVAITRGGFDGPMDTPVVTVMGFTHTTSLGLIEILIGGSLLISGATRSRSAARFLGSVLGIAAFVGAVQTASFEKNLALESGFAWLVVFAALVVVVSAFLLPRYIKRSTVIYPV